MISASSASLRLWRGLVVLVSVLSTGAYAFFACFLHDLEHQHAFIIIEAALDCFFLLDMLVRFFQAFEVPFESREETRFRVIAKRYLQGRFTFDFLALLPLAILFKPVLQLKYLRLVLVLKFWRIVDFGGDLLDEGYAWKVQ